MKWVLLGMALVLFPCQLFAWEATVVSVHDGDTLRVRRTSDGRQFVIRLYGLDAPEAATADWPEQPYAKEATRELQNLLPRHTQVEIREDQKRRSYGRLVATVLLPDGRAVNKLLLERGAAWWLEQYCHKPFCQEWKKAEAEARHQGRGLWAEENPTPPSTWKYGR